MTKCRNVFLPFFTSLILSNFLFAGVTGKIRGFVRDASNGDPLPGVNVIITHTWDEREEYKFSGNLGAATNIDGEYIILRVPPGRYSLTAQMMGYSPMTVQRVQVSVDRTVQVNFDLNQTVIQGQEVVVESKRDIIQLDVSATESYVTEEQYQATPFANRIEDVIGMQSGVSGNVIEGTIKIREGEAHELGYLMDGMEITDKKFNRPVMSIQPGMVEEIKIMRNGFNAEYGQSRSGVINVVSKTPSERIHFMADYQFSPAQNPHYGGINTILTIDGNGVSWMVPMPLPATPCIFPMDCMRPNIPGKGGTDSLKIC